jgi:hypothetical protein
MVSKNLLLGPLSLITFIHIISCQDVYQIGTGIADITGPAAEIGMVSQSISSVSYLIFLFKDGIC